MGFFCCCATVCLPHNRPVYFWYHHLDPMSNCIKFKLIALRYGVGCCVSQSIRSYHINHLSFVPSVSYCIHVMHTRRLLMWCFISSSLSLSLALSHTLYLSSSFCLFFLCFTYSFSPSLNLYRSSLFPSLSSSDSFFSSFFALSRTLSIGIFFFLPFLLFLYFSLLLFLTLSSTPSLSFSRSSQIK